MQKCFYLPAKLNTISLQTLEIGPFITEALGTMEEPNSHRHKSIFRPCSVDEQRHQLNFNILDRVVIAISHRHEVGGKPSEYMSITLICLG